MSKEVESINHLEDRMYRLPHMARQVMTNKQFKETLVDTDNFIMACGRAWKLKAENLGAGMKEVRLIPFD